MLRGPESVTAMVRSERVAAAKVGGISQHQDLGRRFVKRMVFGDRHRTLRVGEEIVIFRHGVVPRGLSRGWERSWWDRPRPDRSRGWIPARSRDVPVRRAQLFGHSVELIGATCRQRDVVTATNEGSRQRPSDPSRRSGDDDRACHVAPPTGADRLSGLQSEG